MSNKRQHTEMSKDEIAEKERIHFTELNKGEDILERGGSHFTKSILDEFMSTSPIYPDKYLPFVVVTVDPIASGSVTVSEMAICAMAKFGSKIVICGLASYKTADSIKVQEFLKFFILKLRQIECLKNSWIVFCTERGTGHDASFLAHYLQNKLDKKVMLVQGKGDGELGWWTTHATKITQLELTTYAIQLGQIVWLKDWIYENGKTNLTREEVASDLRAQLFRYGTYEQINGSSKTFKVSGQIDENGRISRSLRDDKAVALCLTLGVMREIIGRKFTNLDYPKLFPN